MNKPELYHQHQELISEVMRFICRRQHLDKNEAEDFVSYTHVKLLENDAHILCKFRGESSIKSFLFSVIQHLFQDYRQHKWGKWRVSAMARRLGPTAELLETLMVRDGFSFDQAGEIIRTNHSLDTSPEELQRLASQLPVRLKVSMVDESLLAAKPDREKADQGVLYREWLVFAKKMCGTLERVIEPLDLEDRVILKMSFWDGLPVSGIARVLNLEQKPLYRRIDKLLRRLRRSLESEGVGPEAIHRLATHSFAPTDPNQLSENPHIDPSHPV